MSFIALGGSAVSLHQTVLKHAELSTYVGDLGYVVWDMATEHEIIVIPVTVANNGARDAVVLGFKLAADRGLNYRSSLVGGPSAPGDSSLSAQMAAPFAPWEVPGRGSRSGTVQLRAEGREKLIVPPPSNLPVASYALCLTVRTDAIRPAGTLERLLLAPFGTVGPPAPLRFKVTPFERFNTQDMQGGRSVPLEITDVEPIDGRRAAETGQCPAVVQPDAGMH